MTLLALVAGGIRYGLDVRQVEGVVPIPRLQAVAMTPTWVAGVFPFFDRLVPVIDLCLLHGGQPAKPRLGTRVVVTRYPLPDGSVQALGLMAENVTDIVETRERPEPSGLAHGDAPWLEGLVDDGAADLVQVMNPAELLTDEVRAVLFPR